MKYGHVRGHKPERQSASEWYRQIEAENIRKVEAERQVQQQGQQDR